MSIPPFIERLMAGLQPGSSVPEVLKAAIAPDAHILEIGPGASPAFRRRDYPNLKVSDYCDTATLQRQMREVYRLPDGPFDLFDDIDYVCADGRLADCVPAEQRFDLIYSCHNIEHQPDLLMHLRSVETLLKPGGTAVMVVPLKTQTFDLFRQLTTTSDVLMRHHWPHAAPAAKLAFDTDSHSASPPAGAPHRFGPQDPLSVGDLHAAFEHLQRSMTGQARDLSYLHYHVFTPESLQILLLELYLLRQCSLIPAMCTGEVGNSFVIALQPMPWPADPTHAAAWTAHLESIRLQRYRDGAFRPH
ncbi:class I SAM-dependent methyltransferase [Roseateles sp. BYS87W]|uniref:Class I SAM-dependent methyltransferase n=1 Tax=Pelomonas baiyunensis TaxID=3299026 RepID=A0ABW7H1Y2_9BURK